MFLSEEGMNRKDSMQEKYAMIQIFGKDAVRRSKKREKLPLTGNWSPVRD